MNYGMDLNSIYPSEQQDDVTNSSLPWETPNDNIGALIVPTFILFGICGIGVIGNFCLAWVTFKGRNFRSNCYTFIVLNAMSSIVMELWSLSYIHYAINAKYYTTLECRAIGIVPTYCMNISIMLTVMTSADRLFIMVAPKKYLSFSRLTYLIITIAIPIITSAYWAFLSYSNSTEHKDIPHNRKYHIFQWEGPNPMESTQSKRTESNKPAICVFHNYIKDDVAVAHAIFNFVISFGLLLAHCYLWYGLKKKQTTSATTKKIAKALTTNCIILAIQLSTNLFYRGFSSTVIPKEFQLSFSLYIQCFLHIGFASNFFVYFTLSKSYRDAFRKFFLCLNRNTNYVEPIQLNSQNNVVPILVNSQNNASFFLNTITSQV